MISHGIGQMLVLLVSLSMASARADDSKPPTDEQARFFETKIRPVLVDNCLKCHGPEKPKANLRLDSRASALAGGDQGAAVVPGKPDESLLITAVQGDDDVLKMPPSRKLPPEQVDDLTRWVQMGAPWPGSEGEAEAPPPRKAGFQISDEDRAHWAFQKIKRPPVPDVREKGWVENPIDAFVLSGLEAAGLVPNPPAARHELLRRVTYDLTGLPPTPAEVDAFRNDESPDAYEKVVDRLLASPRYGEKWGRHWLDLVRFAETNSYERDAVKPNAWRYRDWVIRSLNDDKPYDRFVREQIAGDELPDRSDDTITATGFYRLGIWDDEPTDRLQAEFDGLDDIVATAGSTFLGLTIECARCHDHKLDPIAQADYYGLLAFFRNITPYRNGGPTDLLPIEDRAAPPSGDAEAVEARREQLKKTIAGIENEYLKRVGDADAGDDHKPDIDDLRYRFFRDTWDKLPDFDALRPEGSGDLSRGLFSLSPRTRDTAIGFVFEGMLIVPRAGTYAFFLDSDDGSRLTVDGRRLIDHDGLHMQGGEKSATIELPSGKVPIRLDYFQEKQGLGLAVAWSGPDLPRRSLSAPFRKTARGDLASRVAEDGLRVLGPDRFERYAHARRELGELRRKDRVQPAILRVTEGGRVPPDTFVMMRGNAHAPGAKVEPSFPGVLGFPPPAIAAPAEGIETSGRRLALADWLASPENPLAARVMANRVFQHHFGRGIVRSPSNFGLQGDEPTHPELLDWLASELIASGWRLKPLHRTIVLSNAYRMSSRGNPEGLEKDPINDRLWRFEMRRLSAEEIRDSILAVSGSLNAKMHGPGVYPEIPDEVLAGQSVPGAGWGRSPQAEQDRRSVYVHVKRSLLLPILEGFDVAETDRSSPVRFSSTQPTQALAMINGKFLNDQAARLDARLRREAGDDPAARTRLALVLVMGRDPSEAELRRGLELVETLRRAGMGEEKARMAFALVALNLDEFLFLD
jgi:hypothetical protein